MISYKKLPLLSNFYLSNIIKNFSFVSRNTSDDFLPSLYIRLLLFLLSFYKAPATPPSDQKMSFGKYINSYASRRTEGRFLSVAIFILHNKHHARGITSNNSPTITYHSGSLDTYKNHYLRLKSTMYFYP